MIAIILPISIYSRNNQTIFQGKVGTEEHEEARRKWREETWPLILKTAGEKEAAILFVDEASFAWWGSLARTWAPVGKQPVVRTKGRRKGLKIFGAIEFQSGKFVNRVVEKHEKRRDAFEIF